MSVADEARAKGTELVLRANVARHRYDRALQIHYQGLWFTLARTKWTSLVLVPADEGDSAAGIATALADVGRRLRTTPVTFLVMAGQIDYASAGRFVSAMVGKRDQDGDSVPVGRVIVAVPPVIVEPLALAVTYAADAVALYIRKGSTLRKSAARTIELVGRERIIGCVLG